MKIQGKIKQFLEIEKGMSKANKEWVKQSIVIDTNDQYNPYICVGFFGEDKVKSLKNLKEGEQVEIDVNISSREFNGKWYHSIDGWKVASLGTKDPLVQEEDDSSNLPF